MGTESLHQQLEALALFLNSFEINRSSLSMTPAFPQVVCCTERGNPILAIKPLIVWHIQ